MISIVVGIQIKNNIHPGIYIFPMPVGLNVILLTWWLVTPGSVYPTQVTSLPAAPSVETLSN